MLVYHGDDKFLVTIEIDPKTGGKKWGSVPYDDIVGHPDTKEMDIYGIDYDRFGLLDSMMKVHHITKYGWHNDDYYFLINGKWYHGVQKDEIDPSVLTPKKDK